LHHCQINRNGWHSKTKTFVFKVERLAYIQISKQVHKLETKYSDMVAPVWLDSDSTGPLSVSDKLSAGLFSLVCANLLFRIIFWRFAYLFKHFIQSSNFNVRIQVKTVQHLAYPRLIADQLNPNQVRQEQPYRTWSLPFQPPILNRIFSLLLEGLRPL
jgi:hypothetical protein